MFRQVYFHRSLRSATSYLRCPVCCLVRRSATGGTSGDTASACAGSRSSGQARAAAGATAPRPSRRRGASRTRGAGRSGATRPSSPPGRRGRTARSSTNWRSRSASSTRRRAGLFRTRS
jgi:hypothetical protein